MFKQYFGQIVRLIVSVAGTSLVEEWNGNRVHVPTDDLRQYEGGFDVVFDHLMMRMKVVPRGWNARVVETETTWMTSVQTFESAWLLSSGYNQLAGGRPLPG